MRRRANGRYILGLWSIATSIAKNAPQPIDAFSLAPSRHVQVPIAPGRLRRRDISAAPWTRENDWQCRAKRGPDDNDAIDGGGTTYYNDDAFGLVFLSASLVVKDFSFAGSFMLLSAIAAAVSNANVANTKKFQPILPGIVAFAALATSKIEAFAATAQRFGGNFVSPLDEQGNQLELIVCSISLLWGIIQQMRRSEDEGKW